MILRALKIFLALVTFFQALPAVLFAEEFNYIDTTPLNPAFNNGFVGNAVKLKYDTTSKRFTAELSFSTASGARIPKGFILGTSFGPEPTFAGELAFLYFDASDPSAATDPSKVKVSAYAYNGSGPAGADANGCPNNPGSWQVGKLPSSPADRIHSINVNGWIYEKQVIDQGTTRTFRLVIDATAIRNHNPIYDPPAPNQWYGIGIGDSIAGFSNSIGVWLWAVDISASNIGYAANGYLNQFAPTKCGMYDFNGRHAKKSLTCVGPTTGTAPVGQLFKATFTGDDPNYTGTGTSPYPLDYTASGLPSGATVTNIPQTDLSVDFKWTPTAQHFGQSFDSVVTFKFKQVSCPLPDYICDFLRTATAACPIRTTVPPNTPPLCSALPAGLTNLTCNAATTTVQLDGTQSSDPDGVPQPLGYLWSSNCPAASFDNAASASPKLSFTSENSDGTPASCQAELAVSDGQDNTTCSLPISVGPCTKDCNGVINGTAQTDRCGVCDGDGSTCVKCTDVDIQGTLFELDQGTLDLAHLAKLTAYRIKLARGKNTPEEKALVRDANKLHNKAWTELAKIPVRFQSCEVSPFCLQTDHSDALLIYRGASSDITAIVKTLAGNWQNALIAAGTPAKKAKKKAKRTVTAAENQDSFNQTQAASVPGTSSTCSFPEE